MESTESNVSRRSESHSLVSFDFAPKPSRLVHPQGVEKPHRRIIADIWRNLFDNSVDKPHDDHGHADDDETRKRVAMGN